MDSQKQYKPVFSFEFFPPKSEEAGEKLAVVRDRLVALNPRFFSVTFGAGGSTQAKTFETVLEIQKETSVRAAPHLSCVGSTRENIRDLLNQYKENNINQIVALRGDIPSGMRDAGEFCYANELVEFIREETGGHFHIEVAAYPEFHPQAANATADLLNFKRKVEAGADSAITQYFYNADSYLQFVESCEKLGLDLPIVPGIMPVTNYTQLARFSDMCGAELPRWMRRRLEAYGDDRDSIREFGLEMVTKLCDRLLSEGAPGLHFYTMNQSKSILAICENLGIGGPGDE
jgi:methylenetetrahydrofolate reductase (NADPH)